MRMRLPNTEMLYKLLFGPPPTAPSYQTQVRYDYFPLLLSYILPVVHSTKPFKTETVALETPRTDRPHRASVVYLNVASS